MRMRMRGALALDSDRSVGRCEMRDHVGFLAGEVGGEM